MALCTLKIHFSPAPLCRPSGRQRPAVNGATFEFQFEKKEQLFDDLHRF
jgi:hypothetical protein